MSEEDCRSLASLHRYIDARAEDHRLLHIAEHSALVAASAAVDKRLDGMNEFRESLNDATKTYVSRDVIEQMQVGINVRINASDARAQRTAIAAGVAAGILGVIGGVILAVVVNV